MLDACLEMLLISLPLLGDVDGLHQAAQCM